MAVDLWWGPIRKQKGGLVGFLALTLLLTSCITVSVESEFNEDGSARHVYTATIERDVMEEFGGEFGEGEFDPEADFAEGEEEARAAGYEVERIDTEDELGLRLSKNVEDNENLGQVLNDFFSSGGTEGDEPVTAFSGSFTEDDNIHALELTVDGTSLFGEELEGEEIPPSMMSSFIEMTYTVRMPGEINTEETNGRILPDGRIEWDIPLSGTETFRAVSETDGDDFPLALVLGGGFLLLVFVGGAAALAILLFMRSRQAPAAVSAGTIPHASPDAPTTQLPQTPPDRS